jgi:putative CocE/NonD family hydrolase
MDLTYALARAALRLPRSKIRAVARRADLSVPMGDGTILLADHWVPDGDTRAPLLLVRSPYGRRSSVGLFYGRTLAHQGFQVLVQSCRGTAGSEGSFDRPFAAESDDGRDTVAWMKKQPFYPGAFATIGGSYLGYTQLALPQEARADQFAAVLQITPTATRDIVLPDGNLALHTALGWSTATSRPIGGPVRAALQARRDARAVHEAGMTAPLLDSYTRASGRRLAHLDAWLRHPDPTDPWWCEEDRAQALDDLDCPVLVQAGWWDAFLEQGIDQFQQLTARGVPARLSIGPWSHASFMLKGAGEVMAEAAQFLRGIAGLEPSSPSAVVRLRDTSGARRLDGGTWPPSAAEPEVLFLRAASLAREPSTADIDVSSFTYDPTDPTPSCGGVTVDLTGGPKDNRKLEARLDVLTFDAAPVVRETTYLGSPTVELWVSADVPTPELFVRLNIVDRKSRSTNLVDRLVRVEVDPAGEGATRVLVTLPPLFRELQPGERLRLLIAGGAYPLFARSTGTSEPAASAATFRRARITVHHDAGHVSRLQLPKAQPSREEGP